MALLLATLKERILFLPSYRSAASLFGPKSIGDTLYRKELCPFFHAEGADALARSVRKDGPRNEGVLEGEIISPSKKHLKNQAPQEPSPTGLFTF